MQWMAYHVEDIKRDTFYFDQFELQTLFGRLSNTDWYSFLVCSLFEDEQIIERVRSTAVRMKNYKTAHHPNVVIEVQSEAAFVALNSLLDTIVQADYLHFEETHLSLMIYLLHMISGEHAPIPAQHFDFVYSYKAIKQVIVEDYYHSYEPQMFEQQEALAQAFEEGLLTDASEATKEE